MSVCVGKTKRGSPRQAQDDPAFDTEQIAQPLDVCDKVGGGVARQVRAQLACEWKATARATLIEQHSLIDVRIEKSSLTNRAARAWTAMQEKRGLTRGIAATFPVDLVAIPHI